MLFSYIKTIAVAQEYQGYSVGTRLINDSIKEFKERKITTICTVAWKNKERTNLQGIMEHMGFKRLLKIDNYWKQISEEEGFHCPVCGAPPCQCSAEIFGLNLL